MKWYEYLLLIGFISLILNGLLNIFSMKKGIYQKVKNVPDKDTFVISVVLIGIVLFIMSLISQLFNISDNDTTIIIGISVFLIMCVLSTKISKIILAFDDKNGTKYDEKVENEEKRYAGLSKTAIFLAAFLGISEGLEESKRWRK